MTSRDLLCLIVIFLKGVHAILSPDGENVCLFDERYIMTIQVREMIPVQVLKVKWCWKFPPRCTVEETEMRAQVVNKDVPRTRIVPKCCKGYAADITESKCLPVCSEPCIHGVCTTPDVCSCESGYYGPQCKEQCLRGKWGRDCLEECDCVNGAICGHVNGECTCSAGWQGVRCEVPCSEYYHGMNCESRCDCQGDPCDHVTGVCRQSTTTELVTTTEVMTTRPSTVGMQTTESSTQHTDSTELLTTETPTVVEEKATSVDFKASTTEINFSQMQLPPTESTTEYSSISSTTEQTTTKVMSEETTTYKFEITNVPSTVKPVHIMPKPEVKEILTRKPEIMRTTKKPFTTSEVKPQKPKILQKPQLETTTDVSNDIEFTQDYNTITGRSQIKNVSLFGLIPSLSLVSGVAGLIFLVTMGSVMLNHHRKMKRIRSKQEQVIKINPADLGIHKFYGESTLPVKTIFENPVYSSDVDFEKDQPTLQSFKPLPAPDKDEPTDLFPSDDIFRRASEEDYDHPPSARSTLNEPVYHEISVIMDYDVPRRSSYRGSSSSGS